MFKFYKVEVTEIKTWHISNFGACTYLQHTSFIAAMLSAVLMWELTHTAAKEAFQDVAIKHGDHTHQKLDSSSKAGWELRAFKPIQKKKHAFLLRIEGEHVQSGCARLTTDDKLIATP